jgi:hypothetical protein
MSMKAQIEFVVIAGLIIVGVIVALVAVQQAGVKPPPTGIEQQLKTIKDSISNVIRNGLKEKMDIIYAQGGVLTPTGTNVEFDLYPVLIWENCGKVSIPNVAKEISSGLLEYIQKNLEEEEEFFGKTAKFDFNTLRRKPPTVKILRDKISVEVYLPTNVEGYPIQQPYEVSIPTKLYEILDFSENFVQCAGDNRIFETITMESILKNSIYMDRESEYWLPLGPIETGCGNSIFRTRSELLTAMDREIKKTVSYVVWNERRPLREPELYPINSVCGKVYPDLEVSFEYPLSWDLSRNFNFYSPGSPPGSIQVIPQARFSSIVPVCIAEYVILYSVRYPVIVSVKDSLTNRFFNFALIVGIENNEPSDCEGEMEISEYSDVCEKEADCSAKVTVRDTNGNPIEGAEVIFYTCKIGKTDSSGTVEGKIPCVGSEFHVYKQGYKSYGNILSSSELKDIEITLLKAQDKVTIHVFGVPVIGENEITKEDGSYVFDKYTITNKPYPITQFEGVSVHSEFVPLDFNVFAPEDFLIVPPLSDEKGSLLDEVEFEHYFYPNEFGVVTITSNKVNGVSIGFFNYTFTLGEEDKDIYMYVPILLTKEFTPPESPSLFLNEVNVTEIGKLTQTLIDCGIEPVSTEAQTGCMT